MTRRIAITVMAVVMFAGILMTPVTLVRVIEAGGDVILCERVSESSTIELTFTHSMYGGDVTEVYTPGANGTLTRAIILADNAAAAEYYAWDGAVRENDGRYEVIVPDQEFASLAVRVDEIGDHRLTIDEETFALTSMVEGSAQVRLSITTRPLVTQLFGTRC